jgi:glycopeptide antibiotics resistance protein
VTAHAPVDRRVVAALGVGYLLVVAFIVFWPSSDVATGSVDRLHAWFQDAGAPDALTESRIEFVCNVLLFVPLSLLGSLLKPQWTWSSWVVVGYLATFSIELLQGLLLPDRTASMQDVVANTGGALVGAVIAWWIRHRPVPG